jgi:hypothetical protein
VRSLSNSASAKTSRISPICRARSTPGRNVAEAVAGPAYASWPSTTRRSTSTATTPFGQCCRVRSAPQWRVRSTKYKLLELGSIKLAAVATDVLGTSGRAMLHGLVAGDQDPKALAELARGRLHAKLPALRQALEGHLQPHHRLLLRQVLAHLDFLEASLAEVQAEMDRHLVPFCGGGVPGANPARSGRDRRSRTDCGGGDRHIGVKRIPS